MMGRLPISGEIMLICALAAVASALAAAASAKISTAPAATPSTIVAQAPAAPTINSVTAGDGSLTVLWTAPAGVPGSSITAYDVRHIISSAADKTDANWTVRDSAWISGSLKYTITGLVNGTGYDVQARAVTTVDGTWSSTVTGTPRVEAPSSVAVTAGDSSLNVKWDAPPGVPVVDVEAYDVRWIVSSTPDKGDSHWTVLDNAWNAETSLGLECTVMGLTNATGYDVQVRAVTTGNGAWSSTVAGTPAASSTTADTQVAAPASGSDSTLDSTSASTPDSTLDSTSASTPVAIGLNESKSGSIDSYGEVDYYSLTLSQAADAIVRVSGGLRDALLKITDSDSRVVGDNATGFLLPNEYNALVRTRLAADTYRIEVKPRFNISGNDGYTDQGAYKLHVHGVTEPGSTSGTAASLAIGGTAGGNLDPATDVDYFRIDTSKSTAAVIRAVGHTADINGRLLDSSLNPVAADVYEETFSRSGKVHGFTIRHTLAADSTHYVEVSSVCSDAEGAYTIQALAAADVPDHSGALAKKCRQHSHTAIADPIYGCQWSLENTGSYRGTPGEDINMGDVWSVTKGAGTVVAVVDSGIDIAHEDLRQNIDGSMNRAYSFGLLHHTLTHGTSVAGIIAGRDNARGITGVVPRATIYANNMPRNYSTANLVHAMTHEMAETAVMNNSWTLLGYLATVDRLWDRAMDRGVTEGFGGKGVFYVWSGGNGYFTKDSPNFDEINNYYAVTTVCAVDSRGGRVLKSETGAVLWVCAPGRPKRETGDDRLKTSDMMITTTETYNRYTQYFGQTSAAAPMVSGVAALIRSAHPDLTWRDVKLILAGSARKNDPSNAGWLPGARKYGSATDDYSFNHEYGFGVVDAQAAMEAADGWVPLPAFVSETRTSPDATAAVPDLGTLTSTVTMPSTVEFTEFVELNVKLDAQALNQLDIELVSPSGRVSTLSSHVECWDRPVCPLALTGDFRLGSARHLGEDSEGTWTLRITDRKSGEDIPGISGEPLTTLNSWSLKAYGHGDAPAAPTITSTAVDDGQITVFWTPPGDTGSSAVTRYEARRIASDASDKSDSQWTAVSGGIGSARTRGHTITGLTNSTGYDVQIRAVNANGNGAWSATATATPAAVLSAPPYFDEGTSTTRTASDETDPNQNTGVAVTATDTDGDSLSYSLSGTDAEHFSIDASSGQIQNSIRLDHETKSDYSVTVSVSDGKDGTGGPDTAVDDTITVSIHVEDTEEAGTVSLSTAAPLKGNQIKATLADPDGGITGTTWQWARSTDKAAWTLISSATSSAYTPVQADVGSYLKATAVYTDAHGPRKTAHAVTSNKVSQTTVTPPPPPSHQRTNTTTPLPSDPPPPPPLALDDYFIDDDDHILEEHINKAAAAGVTLGCSVNPMRYCPDTAVTRAQMAAFLARALQL